MSEQSAAQRIDQALRHGRKTTIISNYAKDAQKHYRLAFQDIRSVIQEAADRDLHDLPPAERKAAAEEYAKSYIREALEEAMAEIDRS